MKELSIVVPVYNTAKTLLPLYERISDAVGVYKELLFVDDGSSDESLNVLKRIARSGANVRVIALERNTGQQDATLCGLSFAKGENICTMDADLQHPPELLPDMIKTLEGDGLDILYAVASKTTGDISHSLGGSMRDLLFHLLFSKSRGVGLSSYRVMSAELLARVLKKRRGFNYFSAMVFCGHVRARSFTFEYVKREEGTSGYTLLKRIKLFARIFLHYGPLAPLMPNKECVEYPIKELIGFERE